MKYDALVIAAHPDVAEAQMGGTLALLADQCQRVLPTSRLSSMAPARLACIPITRQR